ncbi:LysM peptidoglycan-binding domain-containing protein [Lentilactobacillus sp. SPB1-3]|uniref:LysM peptidoglycan-binding domain-containing protein n=1 Tax=Lentilactobacillus terminaliae TaxID=3003483 RepID=A0ACD5DEN1_9LACO|nr:LysM peptidoglycan-binding domain-containing protein [Lentilactobacillus sp. SPB1-3]MCZ0977503.1 LysM peptidoglycan-binding domain-containing protein [Lentilactobacillus sp. SPB1-3]
MKKLFSIIFAAFVALLFLGGFTAGEATTVTVQSGDTLDGISKRFDVSVDSIKEANNLESNLIQVGQKLNVLAGVKKTAKLTNQQPVKKAPVSKPATPKVNTYNQTAAVSVKVADQLAQQAADGSPKAWIAYHESRGSYGVTNGKYIGRYQLDAAYLKGDFSPANQEKVANNYVNNRYGSWSNAKSFWEAHGWY